MLLEILVRVNGNNKSYTTVLNKFKSDKLIDIKPQSVNEKLQLIDYNDLVIFSDNIIKTVYADNDKRYIAVDCTRIHLVEKMSEKGIPKCQNGMCCTGIVSALVDIKTNIPISYYLHIGASERDAFRAQIKYINKKTDVFIFDRGYISNVFFHELVKEGVDVIFRMICHATNVKKFSNNKTRIKTTTIDVVTGKTKHQMKLVRYKVNNENYILGTTLKTATIKELKELYRRRWEIETQFNFIKGNLSFGDIKSRSINRIRQDIAIHQLIMTICYYLQLKIRDRVLYSSEKKINTTSMQSQICDGFIMMLLNKRKDNTHNKEIDDKLLNIIHTMATSTTPVNKDRHFERITKKPVKKFTVSGEKMKQNNKNNRLNNNKEKPEKDEPKEELEMEKPEKKEPKEELEMDKPEKEKPEMGEK